MLRDSILERNTFKQEDGIIYYWDVLRSKWIGSFRNVIAFYHNHRNIHDDLWLKYEKIPSNINGYLINRNSIITCISIICQKSLNTVFRIKNKKNINIYSLSLADEQYKIDNMLNIDIDYGDSLKCFMEVYDGSIFYPTVNVEIAPRL